MSKRSYCRKPWTRASVTTYLLGTEVLGYIVVDLEKRRCCRGKALVLPSSDTRSKYNRKEINDRTTSVHKSKRAATRAKFAHLLSDQSFFQSLDTYFNLAFSSLSPARCIKRRLK